MGMKPVFLRIKRLEAEAKAKGLGEEFQAEADALPAVYSVYERLFTMGVLLIDEHYRASVNPDIPPDYPAYDSLQPAVDAWNAAFSLTD